MPIENYELIGNMHTAALVATDGSIDFMYWPDFDSPSVFCRLLDKNKGGHFFVGPKNGDHLFTKQQYLPSSNILQTWYLAEEGVLDIIDFFPRPADPSFTSVAAHLGTKRGEAMNWTSSKNPCLKQWLIRRVKCIRGFTDVQVEIVPVSSALPLLVLQDS